jgi:hypothetical protein
MKATKIEVQYPTEKVTIVPKTQEAIMRERIFNRTADVKDHYRIVTKVNEAQKIYVHQVKQLVENEFKTPEDYCMEQTGMTPSAYQAKFKRAWND